MIGYLKHAGTQRVVGEVLRENQPMRDLVRHNGFHPDAAMSDGSSLRYVLDLSCADD